MSGTGEEPELRGESRQETRGTKDGLVLGTEWKGKP